MQQSRIHVPSKIIPATIATLTNHKSALVVLYPGSVNNIQVAVRFWSLVAKKASRQSSRFLSNLNKKTLKNDHPCIIPLWAPSALNKYWCARLWIKQHFSSQHPRSKAAFTFHLRSSHQQLLHWHIINLHWWCYTRALWTTFTWLYGFHRSWKRKPVGKAVVSDRIPTKKNIE